MSLPIVSVFSICNAFNWAIKNVLSLTRCVNEYDFLLQETLRVLSPLVTVVTVVKISFVNTCVAYIHLHIFKTVPKINRIYSFILLFIVIYSDQLLFQNWEKEKEAHRLWRSPEKPSHYIDMSESHVKIFTFCGSSNTNLRTIWLLPNFHIWTWGRRRDVQGSEKSQIIYTLDPGANNCGDKRHAGL